MTLNFKVQLFIPANYHEILTPLHLQPLLMNIMNRTPRAGVVEYKPHQEQGQWYEPTFHYSCTQTQVLKLKINTTECVCRWFNIPTLQPRKQSVKNLLFLWKLEN